MFEIFRKVFWYLPKSLICHAAAVSTPICHGSVQPDNQLVHISNGRERFQDRAHHDLIFDMPEVFRFAPWIEIEAKHKEIAIEKLKNEWLNTKKF